MLRSIVLALAAFSATAHAAPANLGAVALPDVSHDKPASRLGVAAWYRNADGHFWIRLPGYSPASTFALANKQTAHRVELRAHANEVYVVMWAPIANGTANAALDAAVASAIAQATKVGDVKQLVVDKTPARDAIVKLPSGATVALRFLVANDRLYAIEVGDETAFNARDTIASFTLRKPADAGDDEDGASVGGSTGWGTIGTGHYGTGSGARGGLGNGKIDLGQRAGGGQLDKAIIRRYVRRNLQKIVSCYETQRAAKPTIEGTVVATFTIKSDGTVADSNASGVDPEVASCIAGVIGAIEFPKPKGGVVVVSYPFAFRPDGS